MSKSKTMVLSFDEKQKFVAVHESTVKAGDYHDVSAGSVWHVVNGNRNRAGDFYFRKATSTERKTMETKLNENFGSVPRQTLSRKKVKVSTISL